MCPIWIPIFIFLSTPLLTFHLVYGPAGICLIPQPLGNESSALTTRPRLLTMELDFFYLTDPSTVVLDIIHGLQEGYAGWNNQHNIHLVFRSWGLTPQPLDQEPSAITTRPQLLRTRLSQEINKELNLVSDELSFRDCFYFQDDRRIRLRQFVLLLGRRRRQFGDVAFPDGDARLFSLLHAHCANRHHEPPGKQILVENTNQYFS